MFTEDMSTLVDPVYDTNRDNSERSRGESLISSTLPEKLLEDSGLHLMPSNVLFCRLAQLCRQLKQPLRPPQLAEPNSEQYQSG